MKRVLKLLVSILLILLLVFLLAGLIFPEHNYETEVTIDRPLDTTFVLFNDVSRLSEWMPTIKSIEEIDENPRKIGSKRKYITENQGNEFEIIETLLDYKKNELVEIQFEAGEMLKFDRMEFSTDGKSTKIFHITKAKGTSYFHRCLFAFFKSAFKKLDQDNLDNFKIFAEANS